jgi:hypothetical protein
MLDPAGHANSANQPKSLATAASALKGDLLCTFLVIKLALGSGRLGHPAGFARP